MSKRRKKIDGQLNLFDLLETLERARKETIGGSFYIQPQIKSLISRGLKQSPLGRYQVAAQMSELTGTEITKWMLDAWTAESKDGHRPPMEILPAFIRVTGCTDLLRFLCEKAGCYMIEGEEVLLTELGRLKKMQADLQRKEREISEYLNKLKEAEDASHDS